MLCFVLGFFLVETVELQPLQYSGMNLISSVELNTSSSLVVLPSPGPTLTWGVLLAVFFWQRRFVHPLCCQGPDPGCSVNSIRRWNSWEFMFTSWSSVYLSHTYLLALTSLRLLHLQSLFGIFCWFPAHPLWCALVAVSSSGAAAAPSDSLSELIHLASYNMCPKLKPPASGVVIEQGLLKDQRWLQQQGQGIVSGDMSPFVGHFPSRSSN